MKSIGEKTQNGQMASTSSFFKRLWSPLFAQNILYFTASTFFINLIIVSGIIWPGEEFHATEMGILIGTGTWMVAVSGFLFGYLADHYSRTKLLFLILAFFGLAWILNGFVPEGENTITFVYFLVFNLIRGFFTGGVWPVINSYTNDATVEEEKSRFFGYLSATTQLIQIIGMIVSAFALQNNYWRQFFWIIGGSIMFIGFFILIRGKEPKRGSTQNELKHVLTSEEIVYDYKLNKEMFRKTILQPTNLIAFFEGIFTTVLLSVPDFLLVAYIQSPPFNFSSSATSLFMVIFGVPGALIGSLAFAKLSDVFGKKDIRFRLYMIVLSIVVLFTGYIILFHLPLPHLTIAQGENLGLFFTFPVIWGMGLIAFIARSVLGLYNINQPPVLQKINLPEAQGIVSSANQFLEAIGSGTGPIIAGAILLYFNENYQITVLLTMGIGIIGGFLWLAGTKWIRKDVARISSILSERAIELNSKNGNGKKEIENMSGIKTEKIIESTIENKMEQKIEKTVENKIESKIEPNKSKG